MRHRICNTCFLPLTEEACHDEGWHWVDEETAAARGPESTVKVSEETLRELAAMPLQDRLMILTEVLGWQVEKLADSVLGTQAGQTLVCVRESCGKTYPRGSRGPVGQTCSDACRKAVARAVEKVIAKIPAQAAAAQSELSGYLYGEPTELTWSDYDALTRDFG